MRSNKKTVSRKQSYKSKKEKTKHKKSAHTKTYKNKLNYRKTKKNKTYNSKYNKKGGLILSKIEEVNVKSYTLHQCVFLDNESKNFININDNVTCIKVADKGDKRHSSGKYDEKFDDYWDDTGDKNKIVTNVPVEDKETIFDHFDTNNSLTTDALGKLKSKLESSGKHICLWDWDRTISMEEGFRALPSIYFTSDNKGYNTEDFTINEAISNYNNNKTLPVILTQYMSKNHINNSRIWKATYKLQNPIEQKEYTNYLLGGKDRVAILKEIFSLDNVKHCVISNNPSFNLFDDYNNKLLLIRAIFNEMGLNSEQNNNILLLHCGSRAKDIGGYTKPEFVNNLVSDKHVILVPEKINTLIALSNYRIHQLRCFLNDEQPNAVKEAYYERVPQKLTPLPRTMSEPVKSSNLDLEPVQRVTSVDNIGVRN